VWAPAIDADGGIRDGGDVAELTGLLDLGSWPEGMRVIVRSGRPHPGAQLSLFEERDGWLYQAWASVMREQINHVMKAARRSNVVVQVIPAAVGSMKVSPERGSSSRTSMMRGRLAGESAAWRQS